MDFFTTIFNLYYVLFSKPPSEHAIRSEENKIVFYSNNRVSTVKVYDENIIQKTCKNYLDARFSKVDYFKNKVEYVSDEVYTYPTHDEAYIHFKCSVKVKVGELGTGEFFFHYHNNTLFKIEFPDKITPADPKSELDVSLKLKFGSDSTLFPLFDLLERNLSDLFRWHARNQKIVAEITEELLGSTSYFSEGMQLARQTLEAGLILTELESTSFEAHKSDDFFRESLVSGDAILKEFSKVSAGLIQKTLLEEEGNFYVNRVWKFNDKSSKFRQLLDLARNKPGVFKTIKGLKLSKKVLESPITRLLSAGLKLKHIRLFLLANPIYFILSFAIEKIIGTIIEEVFGEVEEKKEIYNLILDFEANQTANLTARNLALSQVNSIKQVLNTYVSLFGEEVDVVVVEAYFEAFLTARNEYLEELSNVVQSIEVKKENAGDYADVKYKLDPDSFGRKLTSFMKKTSDPEEDSFWNEYKTKSERRDDFYAAVIGFAFDVEKEWQQFPETRSISEKYLALMHESMMNAYGLYIIKKGKERGKGWLGKIELSASLKGTGAGKHYAKYANTFRWNEDLVLEYAVVNFLKTVNIEIDDLQTLIDYSLESDAYVTYYGTANIFEKSDEVVFKNKLFTLTFLNSVSDDLTRKVEVYVHSLLPAMRLANDFFQRAFPRVISDNFSNYLNNFQDFSDQKGCFNLEMLFDQETQFIVDSPFFHTRFSLKESVNGSEMLSLFVTKLIQLTVFENDYFHMVRTEFKTVTSEVKPSLSFIEKPFVNSNFEFETESLPANDDQVPENDSGSGESRPSININNIELQVPDSLPQIDPPLQDHTVYTNYTLQNSHHLIEEYRKIDIFSDKVFSYFNTLKKGENFKIDLKVCFDESGMPKLIMNVGIDRKDSKVLTFGAVLK